MNLLSCTLFCRDQPGPWQHVFPGRLRLSALIELDAADAKTWKASDFDRLVSSCSNLQALSLHCSPGLQLTALLQLTTLTQLHVTGVTHTNTVASLAQLSGLQRLQRLAITNPCSLPGNNAVLPLTALTQLTYLALTDRADAFSAAMQRRLCHLHKETYKTHGSCHIIRNTVSALIWPGHCQHACFLLLKRAM